LKLIEIWFVHGKTTSRPFAGAWIETVDSVGLDVSRLSRPFAGAWIET